MRIAVLFDGAGLARLGLEQAGHQCLGVELDPWKHHLSMRIGSGNVVLADATSRYVTDLLAMADAVWASPPCQWHSDARTQGDPVSDYAGEDLLWWSLRLPHKTLWVENITRQSPKLNEWGKVWNAAQFLEDPIQNRNRVVGGRYPDPYTYREQKRWHDGICPCITATEWRGCATDARRASRFYGRKLTIQECAYHQGLEIPDSWLEPAPGFIGSLDKKGKKRTATDWMKNLYEAIGNGVPVYMAKAFGEAVK